MHRTHMGVDNNWQTLLLQAMRNALSDGWGGSMIATEVSDILFGVPTPRPTTVNSGVLKTDQVNIVVHGHNPVVSEMVSLACQSPELLDLAKAKGAGGINLVGVCCTGNELLMRRGIAMAGNHLMTELILATGAVDMMIVDYQCIMPSLGRGGRLLPHQDDQHQRQGPLSPHGAPGVSPAQCQSKRPRQWCARRWKTFRTARRFFYRWRPRRPWAAFRWKRSWKRAGRHPRTRSSMPSRPVKSAAPWASSDADNPKIKHDYGHVTLTRRLIENDILVVDTGCVATATAKAGFKLPAAAGMAGPGLKEICTALGIPPVLHMGSCVDNVRILVLVAALAEALGVDISDLPVAGSAPEWYSEKAVTIGTYFVASGVTTHLGPMPPITGSMNVVNLLTSGLKDLVGAALPSNPIRKKRALFLRGTIEAKRKALGLDARSVD